MEEREREEGLFSSQFESYSPPWWGMHGVRHMRPMQRGTLALSSLSQETRDKGSNSTRYGLSSCISVSGSGKGSAGLLYICFT